MSQLFHCRTGVELFHYPNQAPASHETGARCPPDKPSTLELMKRKSTSQISDPPAAAPERLKRAEKELATAQASAKRAKADLKAAKKTAKRARKHLKAVKKKFKAAVKDLRRAGKKASAQKKSSNRPASKKSADSRKKGGSKSPRPSRAVRRPARRVALSRPPGVTASAPGKIVLPKPRQSSTTGETGQSFPAPDTTGPEN